MKATLKTDIYSVFDKKKAKTLGKAGEKITIVSKHGHCLLVNNGYESFTVTEDEIKRDEKERAD